MKQNEWKWAEWKKMLLALINTSTTDVMSRTANRWTRTTNAKCTTLTVKATTTACSQQSATVIQVMHVARTNEWGNDIYWPYYLNAEHSKMPLATAPRALAVLCVDCCCLEMFTTVIAAIAVATPHHIKWHWSTWKTQPVDDTLPVADAARWQPEICTRWLLVVLTKWLLVVRRQAAACRWYSCAHIAATCRTRPQQRPLVADDANIRRCRQL